jgi:hypothetical protein
MSKIARRDDFYIDLTERFVVVTITGFQEYIYLLRAYSAGNYTDLVPIDSPGH